MHAHHITSYTYIGHSIVVLFQEMDAETLERTMLLLLGKLLEESNQVVLNQPETCAEVVLIWTTSHKVDSHVFFERDIFRRPSLSVIFVWLWVWGCVLMHYDLFHRASCRLNGFLVGADVTNGPLGRTQLGQLYPRQCSRTVLSEVPVSWQNRIWIWKGNYRNI